MQGHKRLIFCGDDKQWNKSIDCLGTCMIHFVLSTARVSDNLTDTALENARVCGRRVEGGKRLCGVNGPILFTL
jgi:hypothetical protein